MARWDELERGAPEMAAAGLKLLRQFGVGLGSLATVRRDGGPREHPVCAILCDGGLYVTGRALERTDVVLAARVRAAQTADGGTSSGAEALFELDLERALPSTYKKRREPDSWPPVYTKWRT